MARNKFLKRMAVTALVAAMTVGTVPATVAMTATNVMAETKVLKANDGDAIDDEDLTALQKTVKDAIEAADTDGTTTESGTDASTIIINKINEAVKNATHYEVGSTEENNATTATVSSDGKTVSGSVTVKVPKTDGTTEPTQIFYRTDKATAKQKKVNAATKAVHDALTEENAGDSDYTVSSDSTSDNSIDKVIAKVLTDKGYTDITLKSYTVTKNATTAFEGKFVLHIPATTGTNATPEVVGAESTFSLKSDAAQSTLTDAFVNAFQTAIGNAPMYDDTTADELTTYLNGGQFQVSGTTLKQSGIKVSNVVINSITDTAHGAPGKADVTLTLTDASGKIVRQSYTINTVNHSDAAKLKEATDTTATVAEKYDTSKAQTKTATSALPLAVDANPTKPTKVGDSVLYAEGDANNRSVYGVAQQIVKKALATVINSDVAGNDGKLSADFGDDTYTADKDVTRSQTFKPTIKVTKYTPATSASEGTADVEVTYRTVNDAWTLDNSTGVPATQTATAKFTLTFTKLKAKATTYLELGATRYMKLYSTKTENGKTVVDTSKNDDLTLNAGADGNDPITWTSSDPSVAVVDENGKVTAKNIGTATITATNANNDKVADSVSIVVKNNDDYKFTDVQDAGIFYFSPVYSAVADKVTNGTSDTTFSPDENVTRAQFITWLYKKAGEPAVNVSSKFTDVSKDAFYAKAVSWAVEKGITAGTTSTTFSPDQVLNRAQAVTFLYRVYGMKTAYNGEATSNFTDVADSAYYAQAVNWAVKNTITAGKTPTTFAPNDTCTRGQAVTFLYRVKV